jgi:hypothetical protein
MDSIRCIRYFISLRESLMNIYEVLVFPYCAGIPPKSDAACVSVISLQVVALLSITVSKCCPVRKSVPENQI